MTRTEGKGRTNVKEKFQSFFNLLWQKKKKKIRGSLIRTRKPKGKLIVRIKSRFDFRLAAI